ncbi:hypothetical protein MCOR01_002634 [Pyricularia oryzae]|nr:hypothetical protein MCOR01_002634 [Pyricularia oryzae]
MYNKTTGRNGYQGDELLATAREGSRLDVSASHNNQLVCLSFPKETPTMAPPLSPGVIFAALLTLYFARAALAKPPCPLWGHMYPKPGIGALSTHPAIQQASQSLSALFGQHLDGTEGGGGGGGDSSASYSYAIEVFSADGGDEAPLLWSRYWTAPRLPEQDAAGVGVKTVASDTVFRIGSVTKVFTVLALLAVAGDAVWNDPITKYVPELAARVEEAAGVPAESTWSPDWEDVTIGALAGQTSGIMRDYALLSELTWGGPVKPENLVHLGFPPLNSSEMPPCGTGPLCTREQLLAGMAKQPPSFPPSATPAYSDLGFVLLGWALETITGKPYRQVMTESVIVPLNLTRTYVEPPPDSVGVVPGGRWNVSWAFDMKDEIAAGGMWSSPRDLTKLARGIMTSKLMKPSMTRRWLRPKSFSSDPRSGVGEPWGVRQIPLYPLTNSTYQYVTAFNKAGQIGKYGTVLSMIPELGIGLSIAAAGDFPANINMALADTLANAFIPPLLRATRDAANRTYGGWYRHRTLNSSLLVTIHPVKPGLQISSWTSNGTDMLLAATSLTNAIPARLLPSVDASGIMYPTGLEDVLPGGGRRVSFKAVFEDLAQPQQAGPYTTDCATWISLSGTMYASQPLDQFLFELGSGGEVLGVYNSALRVTLEYVGWDVENGGAGVVPVAPSPMGNHTWSNSTRASVLSAG